MKLILTQEVTGLGAPGDIVEVKDGYGRNYLLPRNFAVRWTRGAEKQIESIRRARRAREIADLDHAQEVAGRLGGMKVTLPARAGKSGRLFGAVTPAEIVSAVQSAGGPELDRRRVEVRNPIKTVGAHEVRVRLHPEVSAKIALTVVAG
ncbi:MAG TPA: 50S ribosomal protein L9 [Streptosporangiaceae bacterium]